MGRRIRIGLLPVGATAIVGFFAIFHARNTAIPYDPFGTERVWWTAAYLLVFVAAAYGFGLPDMARTRLGAAGAAVASVAAATVFVSLAQLALSSPLLPRMVVGGSSLALIPFALLCWRIQVDVNAAVTPNVYVVADPDAAAALHTDLDDAGAAVLVGRTTPDDLVDLGVGGLRRAFDAAGADMLVIDAHALAREAILEQIWALHADGVRIRTLSSFSEERLGKIPVLEMQALSLLFDVGELHRRRYARMSRLLDLAAAIVLLPLLGVCAVLIWTVNHVGNKGPLFYTQPRIGKGGEEFRIIKFRSMVEGKPSVWTAEGDDRITPVGQLLRRSHLDELPQVWNIVRGDCSIVGPRPEQPMYVEQLRDKIPFYDVRHRIRPGLTGWAQTNYGYGADEADALEKLQYDLYYLRHQSLSLDIRILVRTIRTLILSPGR